VPRLTEDEFRATVAPDPVRVGPDVAPPFDFWAYVDAVPAADLDGHDFSEGSVTYVWNMPATPYQHVLIDSRTNNVFLVVVLDLPATAVLGHHLLDLNDLYGITRPPPA
jgi:hypothetical protein